MKTLDKIIKEHKKYLINNGIADWNEKDTKLFAITYASQAIDLTINRISDAEKNDNEIYKLRLLGEQIKSELR